MTSLVEAIRKKSEKLSECHIFSSFTQKHNNKPGANILFPARTLTMDCQNISSIGCEEELLKSAAHVTELDLAGNKLSSWKEIFTLLSCLTQLESLNLSQNPLGPHSLDLTIDEPPNKLSGSNWNVNNSFCDNDNNNLKLKLSNNDTISNQEILDRSSKSNENSEHKQYEFCSLTHENTSNLSNSNNFLIHSKNLSSLFTPSQLGIKSGILNTNTTFSRLTTLALNSTNIPWNWVIDLLYRLPNLTNLHVALNNYGVDEDRLDGSGDSFEAYSTIPKFPRLRSLYYSDNGISSWWTVCRLGKHFPGLEHLVLLGNPIAHIPTPLPNRNGSRNHMTTPTKITNENYNVEQNGICKSPTNPVIKIHSTRNQCIFANLHTLGLSETLIDRWESIDALGEWMPNLTNLRLGNTLPVFQSWPEKECRAHVIARLPKLSTYNRSAIDPEERENAEREFVRHYGQVEPEQRPTRYWELERQHGRLEPLANIDLSPKRFVRVRVVMNEKEIWHDLNVSLKVSQAKRQFCNLFGIQPPDSKRIKIYYFDQVMSKIQGPEELKYPNRVLYAYKLEPGDLFELIRGPDIRKC